MAEWGRRRRPSLPQSGALRPVAPRKNNNCTINTHASYTAARRRRHCFCGPLINRRHRPVVAQREPEYQRERHALPARSHVIVRLRPTVTFGNTIVTAYVRVRYDTIICTGRLPAGQSIVGNNRLRSSTRMPRGIKQIVRDLEQVCYKSTRNNTLVLPAC